MSKKDSKVEEMIAQEKEANNKENGELVEG